MYVAIRRDDARRVILATIEDPREKLVIGAPDGELHEIDADSGADEIAVRMTEVYDSFTR